MNLNDLKYAVISREAYEADEVAQSISPSPRAIDENHVLLSICLTKIEEFEAHIESLGFEIETEYVEGSGKISLLSHAQTTALLSLHATEGE